MSRLRIFVRRVFQFYPVRKNRLFFGYYYIVEEFKYSLSKVERYFNGNSHNVPERSIRFAKLDFLIFPSLYFRLCVNVALSTIFRIGIFYARFFPYPIFFHLRSSARWNWKRWFSIASLICGIFHVFFLLFIAFYLWRTNSHFALIAPNDGSIDFSSSLESTRSLLWV